MAALSGLTIGALTLTPAFDPETSAYAATTANATNTITATAAASGAAIAIDLNGGVNIPNGTPATWDDGENTVTITVTNGGDAKIYSVTVTKEA